MDKFFFFEVQAEVCARFGSPIMPAPSELKVGISKKCQRRRPAAEWDEN